MELLAIAVVLGVLIFLGLRLLAQRQAPKVADKLQQEVTPRMAREAALALDDEQHKAVYRHIAAGNGRQAMASYKEFTGVGLRDSVVAIHALNQYPQPSPSELRLGEELDSDGSFDEEYLEDSIDAVREDADVSPFDEERIDDEGPVAEADPNTGEILGDNEQNVPNIPGAQSSQPEGDDVDARARELMRESGFDPDAELTIPDEWAAPDLDDEPAGFHLEVQRGEEKITLSHEDLEPWVHDQLYALLRDDHVDEAATLLAANSPLTEEEAHRFLVVFKDQS
ncbi:OadG family protein [Nesterenkonia sp. NBAIMH1]|uniref:OadG family protein n=1 Tax=Nesterenkonia sp. NBAIMH1 TaxID=2600320 RepID=UPI0011B7DCD1|nr:OadG family protein [Nesterenkonia sp. NBAIMH1]